ncbi:MAG: hypothetical protein JWM47_2065 [Acidimicrobiales bacterium]|nr:hypothetical protein [Acidimicrobiales bacterium]
MGTSPAPRPGNDRGDLRVRAHHHFTGTPVVVGIDGFALSIERAGAGPRLSSLTFPRKRMYAVANLVLSDGAADGRALGANEHARRYGTDEDAGWRLLRIADGRPSGPVDFLVLSIRGDQLDQLVVMVDAVHPIRDRPTARGFTPIDPAWRSIGTQPA